MRKFAAIPPTTWQTDVRKLRGDLEAIAVYYHLTTSPHSTMIGIYPLPATYLAHDLGSPLEGALKGLRRVIEAGLCTYDEEHEIVWVHDMAIAQVAPRLSPKDNKVSAVAKQLAALPICPITLAFYERYREPFHLHNQLCLEEFERCFLGASEPLRSKEKDKNQNQNQDKEKDLGQNQNQRALEEERYTSTRAREDDREDPFDPPASLQEGKAFLISKGVPPEFMEAAMQRLMREALFPCDIEEWKQEAEARRGAA